MTHLIQGQRVTMPVRIRDAAVMSAMFAVPAETAQALIAYSRLELVQFRGRGICTLVFVRYADGDLGPYHEFGVSFLVRDPEGGRRMGAFIHWLPVNQTFTLDAGRLIWGFPKLLADLPLDLTSRVKRGLVRLDGRTVLEIAIRPGVPIKSGAAIPPIDAYTCLDGVTRRTPWSVSASGVRMRPGGVRLTLGDHPVAEELRALGLDGAHAISSSTVAHLGMEFGDAELVRTRPGQDVMERKSLD